MRAYAGIFIVISLLLLVGTVGAVGIPDTVTVTTDKPWIIANNVDQSTITVTVSNTTSDPGPVQGVIVNLEVDDPLYGIMSPTQLTTNSSGMASSTFKVKTKSGAAKIFANITAPVLSQFTIQNIDHNSAYFADFAYPLNGTVASEVPFNVSITDQYRNPVDNRRGNHIISLHVHGPAPDDCGFFEAGYYVHDIFPALDANGNTSVRVKLTQRIGDNNIAMDGYQSIPNQLEWISAEAKGAPFSMTHVVSPSGSPPTLPADGTSFFTIIYNLFDEYGNPTNEQFIWVNTSIIGEEKQFLSNNLGQVTVKYGPRSTIGEIDITATSVANSTVTTGAQRVKFKNTGAEIISLTANPDTMPSQDANPSFTSNIIATVADQSGNAVAGEMVNFTIEDITYDATYNVTADPNFLNSSAISAITDVYGQAAVQFRPGSFTTTGNLLYNATATGHCNVVATWKNSSKIVPITWKNYPYLSVSTSVTPLTVEINQTIDVTIEFKGDGWALQPIPIDAVLCTDRSGSMMYDNPDRMVNIMGAAATFVDQLGTNDQIGVVSFGQKGTAQAITYIPSGGGGQLGPGSDSSTSDDVAYRAAHYPTSPKNYADYATLDLPLSFNKPQVKTEINSMVPYSGTPMRSAIYKSIQEINLHSRSNTVKAIILLSDGDYNWYGDPLAQGNDYSDSWGHHAEDYNDLTQDYMTFSVPVPDSGQLSNQNMSVYAKNSGIRIYSIAFGNQITAGGKTTLRILAEGTVLADGTRGKYYEASATDITDVYKAIATDLQDTAAVNTSMTADFEHVNVTGWEMDGDQVFDYVYHPTDSTKINWQDGVTTNVTDQSADWDFDNKLDFTIGTIKVGQSWNATFRLRVNQSGLIDVFGKNSTVSFNGGTEILNLPQTFITVVPQLNVTLITAKTITLDNLTVTAPGKITALLPVTWNTNYTGNKTLTEKVYYQIDNGPWVLFDTKTHVYDPLTMEYTDFAQLDVTKLPPGIYQIKVYATASDAPDATKTLANPVIVGNRGTTFIKLE